MNTLIGLGTDDLLAAWERSTDRPVPPFVAPDRPRWRTITVLALVGVALVTVLAGALIVGPLAGPRPVQPTLEAGLDSLEAADALEFRLRLEVTHPTGYEGLAAEGVAVPASRAVTATGRTLRPGSEWPFGPVGNGALVVADGRLFIRHGSGLWDEIEPEPPNGGPDGPVDVLSRLLDGGRLAAALRTAVAATETVSSDYIGCGEQRCARYDVELDRAAMHALVEAATGLTIDEPSTDVSPLVATFVIDPIGQLVSLDAGLTEEDGTVRFHLELAALEAAPSIEPPLP